MLHLEPHASKIFHDGRGVASCGRILLVSDGSLVSPKSLSRSPSHGIEAFVGSDGFRKSMYALIVQVDQGRAVMSGCTTREERCIVEAGATSK